MRDLQPRALLNRAHVSGEQDCRSVSVNRATNSGYLVMALIVLVSNANILSNLKAVLSQAENCKSGLKQVCREGFGQDLIPVTTCGAHVLS